MSLLHEWPLVLFTLTVQAAVGLHLALLTTLGSPLAGGAHHRAAAFWGSLPSRLVGLLMAVALIISVFHLGAPINAFRTLSNLEESWLSREILAALVFLGLWGLGFWSGRRPGYATGTARVLAWVTGVAGVALIWAMARIYMVPARPVWDHWLTAAGFFLTGLLLGATTAAAWMEGRSGSGVRNQTWISDIAGVVLLAGGLTAALAQVAVAVAHPVTGWVMASGAGRTVTTARLLFLLGGAFLMLISLVSSRGPGGSPPGTGKPGRWAAVALILVGLSEVMGRMLFYAAGTAGSF